MKIFIATALLLLLALSGFSQPTRYERVMATRQIRFGSKQVIGEGPGAVFLDTILVTRNTQRNVILDITASANLGTADGQYMMLITNMDDTLTIAPARWQKHLWHGSGTLAKARYLITPIGNKVLITGYGIVGKVTWKVTKQ